MFGKEADAAGLLGEGRKTPNRREEGEGRRGATPFSPISQVREASASLRCGIFERLGSVGAAQ